MKLSKKPSITTRANRTLKIVETCCKLVCPNA